MHFSATRASRLHGRVALVAALTALLVSLTLVPASATAKVTVAYCTVNGYVVKRDTHLFDWNGNYLRTKHAGAAVIGPNSNVMNPNIFNGYRVVYVGGVGYGQMWAANLDYAGCS